MARRAFRDNGRQRHLRVDIGRVRLNRILRRCLLPPNSGLAGDDYEATPLVSGVLEQALFTRRRTDFRFTLTGLVHHADAGSLYRSLAFTEALVESGITGSIGSVADALDNAMMESAIGLYMTEPIRWEWVWTGRAEAEREAAE
ncbi:conserved hypothetical protein [Rhodococcus jostii RHA1]|uniref:Transposase n=1 Tax=Rhodococcus jostii (strain RHA1) TaxID=101510 RepID=Q0SJY6_RHOJR|nr:conserved hypothetical protein [Rhodococcus jostii RHA1]